MNSPPAGMPARVFGLPIGLYRSAAVGVARRRGNWCDRELYCLKASVGSAPPDISARSVRTGGCANGHYIVARAYEPFYRPACAPICKLCGALRIDHVMSLLRLWWIPVWQRTADRGETSIIR
ncbi:4-alpha-glucanotransferase [Salmonella enterica subsp. enterica]|nr:4-alpha-glucanotransferase [Salmonella enterica subsp. enterica]